MPTGNDGDLALETKSIGWAGFALDGRQAKLLAQGLDAFFCLVSHCDGNDLAGLLHSSVSTDTADAGDVFLLSAGLMRAHRQPEWAAKSEPWPAEVQDQPNLGVIGRQRR